MAACRPVFNYIVAVVTTMWAAEVTGTYWLVVADYSEKRIELDMAQFQVRLDMVWQGQKCNNITYWVLPDADSTTLQDFADALRSSMDTTVKAQLGLAWQLQSLTMRQMDGGGAFSQIIPFTGGFLTGTNNADPLPSQDALLVSTSATAPRPNRGRVYFCGLTEGSTTGGKFTAAIVVLFSALVDQWRTGLAITAGTCQMVIARPNLLANTWAAFNAIDGVFGRDTVATQRRRRLGSGT